MVKKIILALIIAIVSVHAGWYAASRVIQSRTAPDRKIAVATRNRNMEKFDIHIDEKSLEETDIDANGVRLHLSVFAQGKNAPTLVFIPGTSVYAQIYIDFMYRIYRQGFNVVGFDPRGHGLSGGRRGDYTIDELVADTRAVVNYARQRFGGRPAIAGSSQGGMVAFYTAARDDSISAAVCHNLADLNGKDNLVLSTLRIPPALSPIVWRIMSVYESYMIPISLYLDLKKEHLPDGSDAAAMIGQDPLCVTWISVRAMRSLLRTGLAKPVEKIRVPIMLIHSDRDNIFPRRYVEGIYRRLSCPKNYLLLKERDHLVMTNNAGEVVPPVSAWLKKIMR